MTGFDFNAARAARAANPRLTEFDTGEILQPQVDPRPEQRGWVDFDNDESGTEVRLQVTPSAGNEHGVEIVVNALIAERIDVVDDSGDIVWWGERGMSADERETLSMLVPTGQWPEGGTDYTDIDGITRLMDLWAASDVRRSWPQDGDQDAVLVWSYWDSAEGHQVVGTLRFDTDAAAATGFGWSLFGLPFDVELPVPASDATPTAPVTVADLDGTVDAADWIQVGHVLEASEVDYIRGLRLPE